MSNIEKIFGLGWLTGLAGLSILVGILYLVPPLAIRAHLARSGQPFVLSFESYRNDLTYLAWAREIYDGHFPPRDPFSDVERPIVQNPLPSLILAGFLAVSRGNAPAAYLTAVFIFSQMNFLLAYWLFYRLSRSHLLAILAALVMVLTPIALRILNFDGTA